MSYKKLFDIIVNELGVKRDETTVYPSLVASNLITGMYLREEILFREGEHKLMLDEIKSIYYPMALETGTLWECNKSIDKIVSVC